MRTYCSLIITSETDARLEATVQKTLGLTCSEFADNQSPERLLKVAKLNEILGRSGYLPARYVWSLTSKDAVESAELQVHIAWLLDQVIVGRTINDVLSQGNHAFLTCFAAGNGRGGGPTLSANVMRTIAAQGVELQFDFYVEESDSGVNGVMH
jgi:hypothetical protein